MAKQMISVSTKTGDAGKTSLANGQRLSKDHPVFGVIGELDELNSWLGLIAAMFENQFEDHKRFLYVIQDTLFYIGAELALSPKAKLKAEALTLLEKHSEELQKSMTEGWHTRFLLPGGTQLGGFIDVARTVCRRAERALVAYAVEEKVSPMLLKYVNRLSDYLYVLRCFVNHAVAYKEQEFRAQS